MARYDKYDPIANGFRAHVASDYPDDNLGKLYGVGLDSTGKVVIGAGQSGIIGVLVVTEKAGVVGPLRQVSVVDIMTHGCVTDFGPTSGTPGVDFGVAGTVYYSDSDGNISPDYSSGSVYVGSTVEPDRLEVNVIPVPASGAVEVNPPTGLKAGTATDTQVPLNWTKSANADSYVVQQSTDGDTWTAVTSANGGEPSTNSTTVKGLTASTEYQFRVAAKSGSVTSAYTAPVTVTTAAS